MKAGEDPRPDQSKDRPGGGFPDPNESNPKPAPGGVGTGTQADPAKNIPPNPVPPRR